MATYQLLEPSLPATVGTGANLSFNTAGVNSVSGAFSLLFSIGIIACLIASGGVFLFSGFLRLTATGPGDVGKSNEGLKRASYGLIGVLLMYLILNEINPNLLKDGIVLPAITGFGGTVQTNPANTNSGGVSAKNLQLYQEMAITENGVRNALSGVGIQINRPNACVTNGTNGPQTVASGCTSVGGMSGSMVNDLILLNAQCKTFMKTDCHIVITGGTEWWLHGGGVVDVDTNKSLHKPASAGGHAVDFSMGANKTTDPLYLFVTTNRANFTPLPSDNCCSSKYQYGRGYIFCDELPSCGGTGAHWHVQ